MLLCQLLYCAQKLASIYILLCSIYNVHIVAVINTLDITTSSSVGAVHATRCLERCYFLCVGSQLGSVNINTNVSLYVY